MCVSECACVYRYCKKKKNVHVYVGNSICESVLGDWKKKKEGKVCVSIVFVHVCDVSGFMCGWLHCDMKGF